MEKQEWPAEIARRTKLLDTPTFAKLKDFRDLLRRKSGHQIITPDPHDGGMEAQVLLLATNVTNVEVEYGMASLDLLNPAFLEALGRSGLDRRNVFYWSIVPWEIRNRFVLKPGNRMVEEGLRYYTTLTSRAWMPNLKAVVLLGQSSWVLANDLALVGPTYVNYYETWSPDRHVKYTLDKQDQVETRLREVKQFIGRPIQKAKASPKVKEHKEIQHREYSYA